MEIIKFINFSFTYEGYREKALDSLNFTINKGEFVTIIGKSGCGKSTLLRQLKPRISPEGEIEGELLYSNTDIYKMTDEQQASKIGFVFQNPDNGIVTDKVWHELAFGLENLGVDNREINIRVAETASYFGIDNWFEKNVCEISGGQKQLLNLASAMVMQPDILVLDEPTAQLDPLAAQEFLAVLRRINKELGTTVVLSEHRLDELFTFSDKIIALENGKIIDISSPERLSPNIINNDLWHSLPTPIKVASSVGSSEALPVSIKQGREWLDKFKINNDMNLLTNDEYINNFPVAIKAKNLWFGYTNTDIIKGCDLEVKESEIYAILGGNGSGKTTLLSLLCQINKPSRGKITVAKDKKVVMLPQNPQSLFVKNRVLDELCEISAYDDAVKMADICGIKHLLNMHPYDLSGGEQQKTALAMVLLTKPNILLLDEPTKALDSHFKYELAKILIDLKNNGMTIIMVSHDIEFCAEYADKCALFFNGRITTESCSKSFFSGKNFYTTSANRMSRGIIDNAVTCSDLIYACKGQIKNFKSDKNEKINTRTEKKTNDTQKPKNFTLNFSFLILMLLTVIVGMCFFDKVNFYLISSVLMTEAFLHFIIRFEKRRPKAREVVMISVLCAIAVAGRTALYMLPQFKPMIAIVIISGVCFGGETGFLVGALSAFVSNFFMGQGPWTPWQMFALGAVGFFAGFMFKMKLLNNKKIPLIIYGVFASIFIYGLIMNSATVIMTGNTFNIKFLVAALLSGLPFDIIHALATAIFLWFAAEPLIIKLERVKKKYKIIN